MLLKILGRCKFAYSGSAACFFFMWAGKEDAQMKSDKCFRSASEKPKGLTGWLVSEQTNTIIGERRRPVRAAEVSTIKSQIACAATSEPTHDNEPQVDLDSPLPAESALYTRAYMRLWFHICIQLTDGCAAPLAFTHLYTTHRYMYKSFALFTTARTRHTRSRGRRREEKLWRVIILSSCYDMIRLLVVTGARHSNEGIAVCPIVVFYSLTFFTLKYSRRRERIPKVLAARCETFESVGCYFKKRHAPSQAAFTRRLLSNLFWCQRTWKIVSHLA